MRMQSRVANKNRDIRLVGAGWRVPDFGNFRNKAEKKNHQLHAYYPTVVVHQKMKWHYHILFFRLQRAKAEEIERALP